MQSPLAECDLLEQQYFAHLHKLIFYIYFCLTQNTGKLHTKVQLILVKKTWKQKLFMIKIQLRLKSENQMHYKHE